MDFTQIYSGLKDWLFANGLQVALTLIIMLVALKVVKVVIVKLFSRFEKYKDDEFKKRNQTLQSIILWLIRIIIICVALTIVLQELGIAIGPILATAGVLGLAVGFGAQSLVQDVISGFFLLLEDQVRVGDVVQVSGKGGMVEKVNLRMIILRDLAGNVHYIRNGKVDLLTNMTKEYSRYVFEIGVAYREDVDNVIEVIKEVDEELRNDPQYTEYILEPIEIMGLDKFADSAVIIKARTKTKPVMQWTVGREFNRRLKRRFDQEGIEIPYPHMTLYIGEDKQGQAAPLRVSISGRNTDIQQ